MHKYIGKYLEKSLDKSLDKYLEKIPDEPSLPNYIPTACNLFNAKPSNSIVDQGRKIIRRPG